MRIYFLIAIALSLLMLTANSAYAHDNYSDDGICHLCKGSGRCMPTNGATGLSARPYCFGTGNCGFCNGSGKVHDFGITQDCINCKGTGKCVRCGGTGKCPRCHGINSKGSGVAKGRGTRRSDDSLSDGREEEETSSDSAFDASNVSDFLYLMNPYVLPIAIGLGAAISYGVFASVAMHNREATSFVFPSAEVRTGYSLLYGMDISVRASIGGKGGFLFTGGLGVHPMSIIQGRSYHLGGGFFISPGRYNSISWTWELAQCLPVPNQFFVSTIVDYSHFLGASRRHGLFVGAGAGYGNWLTPLSDARFQGEFRLGYTYRFYEQPFYEGSTEQLDAGLFFGAGLGWAYNVTEFLIGYKINPHWRLALEVAAQPSPWAYLSSNGYSDISQPISLSLNANYRFNDNKWSPFAAVSLGSARAYATDFNSRSERFGRVLLSAAEAGMSMRFYRNNYLEMSLGAQFSYPILFSGGRIEGKAFTPGILLRYIRCLDFGW